MPIRAIRFLVKYILHFPNGIFVSGIEASFLESKLLELKFCFWSRSFVSEIQVFFSESKLLLWAVITSWKRSYSEKEASIPETNLRFRKGSLGARSLVVSDLRSETKGSRFESGQLKNN